RPGNKINKRFIEELRGLNPDVYLIEKQKSIDTSSSYIRAHLYKTDMSNHLSQDILEYIKDEGLYL
ncbi:MAG: hypothetical protein AB8B80_05940, partial [Marinicellaceae bacterium]